MPLQQGKCLFLSAIVDWSNLSANGRKLVQSILIQLSTFHTLNVIPYHKLNLAQNNVSLEYRVSSYILTINVWHLHLTYGKIITFQRLKLILLLHLSKRLINMDVKGMQM